MSLDELNNSQIALLSLLISFVVGAAMAVAVLAVLIDDIVPKEEPQGQTVIKQTVNRIIERTTTTPASVVVDTEEEKVTLTERDSLSQTTDRLKKALIPISYRGSSETVGIFLSPTGVILVPKTLSINRKYTISVGDTTHEYAVTQTTPQYSLIESVEPLAVAVYLSPQDEEVLLGMPLLLYGGIDDDERLFFSTVSQVEGGKEGVTRFRVDVHNPYIAIPSVVVINGKVSGFLTNEKMQWVQSIPKEFFETITSLTAPPIGQT